MTLYRRFLHWRLRKARRALYRATLYRRQQPVRYELAALRAEWWEYRWIMAHLSRQ